MKFEIRNSKFEGNSRSELRRMGRRAGLISDLAAVAPRVLKSGGGPPHSKTLRETRTSCRPRASVLECGSALPLFGGHATLDRSEFVAPVAEVRCCGQECLRSGRVTGSGWGAAADRTVHAPKKADSLARPLSASWRLCVSALRRFRISFEFRPSDFELHFASQS